MKTYFPQKIKKPERIVNVPSAWVGLDSILEDIVERFDVARDSALEFGVEYGYSTVALSNFFKKVVGVDTFKGDTNTFDKNIDGFYERIKESLRVFPNIELLETSYQEFIKQDLSFDLIHVDIVHTYEDTFACGDWAISHAPIVIFHDTESFRVVKEAVADLAKKHDCEFYNYPFNNGLGICTKKQMK